MILHIAVTRGGVRDVTFGKLFKEHFGFLAARIDEHIQPSTVSHTDKHVGHASGWCLLDDLLEGRHHRFATFDREAFRTHEGAVHKAFELFGADDGADDTGLRRFIIRRLQAARFDALEKPATALGVLDVHHFHADRATVSFAQAFDDLLNLKFLSAKEIACV